MKLLTWCHRIKILIIGNKYKVALAFVLFVSFLLSNYVLLSGKNWFVTNSEAEMGIFTENFFQNGQLKVEEINIEGIDSKEFAPFGVGSVNGYYVPKIALGTVFLGIISKPFGSQGFFLLFSVINLIGAYYIYKLSSGYFGKGVGVLAASFYALSLPVLYWGNYLYGNLPAISFFIIGLFYLTRFVRASQKFKYLILSVLFIVFAVWVRYEILVFALFLAMVFLVFYRKYLKVKHILLSFLIICVFFILPFLYLNKKIYGNPLTVGYTAQEGLVSKKIDKEIDSTSIVGQVEKIYKRVPLVRSPVKRMNLVDGGLWIFDKYYYFAFRLTPIISLLSIIGIFILLIKRGLSKSILKKYFWVFTLLVCSLFIIYFEGSAYHGGWSAKQYDGIYSRYWFVYFVLVSILAAVVVFNNFKDKRLYGFMIIAMNFIIVISVFFSPLLNISALTGLKNESYYLYRWSKSLPDNSIIVANSLGKSITSIPVLKPIQIEGYVNRDPKRHVVITDPNKQSFEALADRIDVALNQGYKVYLVESEELEEVHYDMASNLDLIDKNFIITSVQVEDVGQIEVYELTLK